jgi:hypothetical protein
MGRRRGRHIGDAHVDVTAQPVENTEPLYGAYQKKHYMERTTGRMRQVARVPAEPDAHDEV